VHSLVRAHGQRLADGVGRLLRAHGDDRDLAAVSLSLAKALLDRVVVEFVDHGIGGVPIQSAVICPELALRPGVRYLLDQDHDVHDQLPTFP
jgi:hypothetical protein